MMDLLRALIARFTPQPLDPRVEQLLARAIEGVDPRLKAFGNYPRSYRPAITRATRYATKLAGSLPPCIDLSPARFAQEPLLHALFSDVAAIHQTVRDSREIKQYCREHGSPQSGEIFALMGMRRHEKSVIGREMKGDEVQPDVQQTMVYFDDHTLTLPSTSPESFMQRLEENLFDSLMHSFGEQLAQALAQKSELETERDILVARQRSSQSSDEEMQEKIPAIRRQLQKLDDEYALNNYSELLNRFMDERQQYLRLERREIPIDMRGVMRESSGRLAGRFTFYDLIGRDRRRWTLCPVRLPVDELYEAMHCAGTQERWLEI
jgi:hypothetical protein